MKRMIMLFGWMLIVCMAASGQTHFLEQVDWGTPSVVKQGENVRVKVDIRLDAMRLKIQQALRLVPVIVSADGSQEAALQPVVIEGRVRFRVTERKQALGTWEETEGTVGTDRPLLGGSTVCRLDGERTPGNTGLYDELPQLPRRGRSSGSGRGTQRCGCKSKSQMTSCYKE